MSHEPENASGAAPAFEKQTASAEVGENADFSRLLDEANALALYVARHGDSLSDENKDIYVSLLEAISAAESSRSSAHWQALMKAYADVTAITYGVRGISGRTILDTQASQFKLTGRWLAPYRPTRIGSFLFFFVLVLEMLMSWAAGVSDPGMLSPSESFVFALVTTLYTFLASAAWGGLGACVFLAKRITDKLSKMAYEEARMRGDVTRVFLGAMLGVVVVVLFFPSFGEQALVDGKSGWSLGIAAFVAGLGVKPVYAAFESLSEELARRFKASIGGESK